MSLNGQVGLVTGAASGIGAGVAARLAADGATVVCLDLNDPAATVKQIEADGGVAEGAQLDVRSAAEWADVVDGVNSRHGRVDFLINVAGIPVTDPAVKDTAEGLTEDAWSAVVDTNVKGSWLGIRTVIPYMRAGGGGRIVNTSSVAASRGLPGLCAYSVSKGAVDALTRSTAFDFAADNILVNAIAPGFVLTPLAARTHSEEQLLAMTAMQGIRRPGSPAEIAAMAAFLVSDGTFVTGQVLAVDGGWTSAGLPA